ncbi:MAG: hypothetical protein ACTSWD_15110 [Candidatus Heimdallarchaeota archaeon]
MFKKYLSIFLAILFLFIGGTVFALELKYPPLPGAESPQVFLEKIENKQISPEKAFPLFVKYFITLTLIISVSVCLIILMIGGFRYLISGANPIVMADALKQISQAVLGLVVILSSYIILSAINPELSIIRLPWIDKPAPSYTSEPLTDEKGFAYFQTSVGKIIEDVVLTKEAHEKFEGSKNIDYLNLGKSDKEIIGIIEKAEMARDESENLKNLSQELKDLTDACLCGESSCQKTNCGDGCCCQATGCSQINTCSKPCGCSIISLLPCNLASACPKRHCDLEAISKKIIEIQVSMAKLEIQQKQVFTAQLPLLSDYIKLKKTGMMISMPENVEEYGEFFKERERIKQDYNEETDVDTFSNWPDSMVETEAGLVQDPTSIYFDKKLYENKKVIEESSRVEALLVQTNLSPKDLNEIMTENAQEVLSQYSNEDFMPSSEEMANIIQESIDQASAEITPEISETLTNALIEELTASIIAEAGGGVGASAGISAELGNQIGFIISEELPPELDALFSAQISIDMPNILSNLNMDGDMTIWDLISSNLPSGTTINNIPGLSAILAGDPSEIVPNLDLLLNLQLSDLIPADQLPNELLNATLSDILPSEIMNILNTNFGSVLPAEFTNFLNSSIADFLPSEFINGLDTSIGDLLPPEISDLLNLNLNDLFSGDLLEGIDNLLSASLIDLLPSDLTNILSLNIGELLPGDLMNIVYATLGEILGIDLDEFFPDFLLNLPDNLSWVFEGTTEDGVDYSITINITGLPNLFNLIPGLSELTTIFSEIFDVYNQIQDLLDTSLADFLPQEILDLLNTNLASFLPEKLMDALSMNLADMILPEEINTLLTANLSELLPENITNALNISMVDILPENINNILNTSLIDEMPFEIGDILNSNLMDQLPSSFTDIFNTSLVDKLDLPSADLKDILLESLASENPELYNILTTSLGNNIPPETLEILQGNFALNMSPAGQNIFNTPLTNILPSTLLSVNLETGELSNKIQDKIEENLSVILRKELQNKLSETQINDFSSGLIEKGVIQEKTNEILSEDLPAIIQAVSKKSSQMISRNLSEKLSESIAQNISDKTSEQISEKVSADLGKLINPVMVKMLDQGMILNFPHDLRILNELHHE